MNITNLILILLTPLKRSTPRSSVFRAGNTTGSVQKDAVVMNQVTMCSTGVVNQESPSNQSRNVQSVGQSQYLTRVSVVFILNFKEFVDHAKNFIK